MPVRNGLGYVDHSAFGALGVNLAFGRRADGTIAHISEVERGLACGCVCPACEVPIVAHKRTRQHHFKHHRNSAGCTYGPETNAHYFAKRVLEREKWITVPARLVVEDGQTHIAHPARRMDFDAVVVEPRQGRIIPDLLVIKDGHRLFIEIFVTHRCDDAKIAYIRSLDTSAVEIDLSALRASLDDNEIAEGLLTTAPRAWLHNRLQESDRTKIRLAKARRLREEAAEADVAAKRVLAAIRNATVDPRLLDTDIETVNVLGRNHLVGHGANAAGCTVATAAWQALLLVDLVILPSREGQASFSFTADDGLAAMADYVIPELSERLPENVAARLQRMAPDLVLPVDAIEAYLQHLLEADVLEAGPSTYPRRYRVSSGEKTDLRRSIADYQARETREAEAERRLQAVLSRLSPDELATFDIIAWEATIPGIGKSLGAVCAKGDAWRDFSATLHEIEAMMRGGAPVRDFLGLPLARVRAEALEVIAAKREEDMRLAKEASDAARKERVDSMRALAQRRLREDADAWLNSPNVYGMTPLAAAAEALSLDRLRDEIHDLAEKRLERVRQQRVADDLRNRLRALAMQKFSHDERRANLFLNASQPALGGQSPLAYCRDEPTLGHCMHLMSQQARPRR